MKDPYIREKFTRERSAARKLAKEYFERFPKDRYGDRDRSMTPRPVPTIVVKKINRDTGLPPAQLSPSVQGSQPRRIWRKPGARAPVMSVALDEKVMHFLNAVIAGRLSRALLNWKSFGSNATEIDNDAASCSRLNNRQLSNKSARSSNSGAHSSRFKVSKMISALHEIDHVGRRMNRQRMLSKAGPWGDIACHFASQFELVIRCYRK